MTDQEGKIAGIPVKVFYGPTVINDDPPCYATTQVEIMPLEPPPRRMKLSELIQLLTNYMDLLGDLEVAVTFEGATDAA